MKSAWHYCCGCLLWLGCGGANLLHADLWKCLTEQGTTEEIHARLVCSEKNVHLLELPSGEYRIIPQQAVRERIPKDDLVPLTSAELAEQIAKPYPAELIRREAAGQYAVVIVLGSPLPTASEERVRTVLKKGLKFLTTVETVFGAYCKQAKLAVETPRLPLGMIVFESESDFEKYANQATQGSNLKTGQISGFYSGLTNRLALRLSECNTFEVPAHEAMHQQAYNRGILQRFSPIPHWFDEGLATGFETVGGKISGSPFKVSTRYARQALEQNRMSWSDMLKDDRVFAGGVLVGEAYGQAWGLHWLAVTKHKAGYVRYLQTLSRKTPLQQDSPEIREQDFEAAFGCSVKQMESEFLPVLRELYQKKRKASSDPANTPPGQLVVNDALADVEMFAVRDESGPDRLRVKGRLRNASPLRAMSYYVTVETDVGDYADWLKADVPMNRVVPLELQVVRKRMSNAPPATRNSSTFRVRVRSAPQGTSEAESWKQGDVPTPAFE